MPNTALNRTVVAILTNKSGGDLNYGDVVILNNTDANGFTTTTSAGLSTRGIGVIQDVNGIANNASGMVAVAGWVAQINLNAASTVGQFIQTHTVAGQGTPHDAPQEEGDFAVALTASATPAAVLFGSPVPPGAGAVGTVTNTGTLTDHAVIVGNGGVDVSALASLGNAGEVLTSAGAGADPAWALAGMTLIEEQTPSGVGTLTFSSLGSFTHLEIRYSARSSKAAANEDLNMRFNGDTGSNYDTQILNSFATTTSSGEGVPLAFFGGVGISAASATAGACGVGTISIYDYRGTTFFKGVNTHALRHDSTSSGGTIAQMMAGAWLNTAAVTSITLLLQSGNFDAGSKFTLYGLR